MKLYAIVSPAFTMGGDALANIGLFFVAPYHRMVYERVCGYSLGHAPHFYDTVEDAKSTFTLAVNAEPFIANRLIQNALIELDLDDSEQIVAFSKLYEVTEVKKHEKKIRVEVQGIATTAEAVVYEAVFNIRDIKAHDYTQRALAEINRFYQEHLTKNPKEKKVVIESAEEGSYGCN